MSISHYYKKRCKKLSSMKKKYPIIYLFLDYNLPELFKKNSNSLQYDTASVYHMILYTIQCFSSIIDTTKSEELSYIREHQDIYNFLVDNLPELLDESSGKSDLYDTVSVYNMILDTIQRFSSIEKKSLLKFKL